jgi:dTDP-glucose 4,6-dehydratase
MAMKMAEPCTIAVLGSNSFSGSDFADLLLEDPQTRVLGISRGAEKSVVFLPYKRRPAANFRFFQLDMNRDGAEILRVLDEHRPAYVVNFAAQSEVAPSWQHPEQWFQTNAVALAWLLIRLKDRRYLQRYLHISSPEVYGTCTGRVDESSPLNPSTPYAASKAAADLFLATLVKNFNFPLLTIRATNVYGAHQQLWKIIPRSVIYLKSGRKIELHGGGRAVKSFIHIRDVSRGETAALFRGQPGAIYHLSPNDGGHEVRDVVRRICGLLGKDFAAETVSVGERLGQDAAYVIDSSKARQELGWRPQISLDEGLAGVVRWVEENWQEIARLPLEYQHRA